MTVRYQGPRPAQQPNTPSASTAEATPAEPSPATGGGEAPAPAPTVAVTMTEEQKEAAAEAAQLDKALRSVHGTLTVEAQSGEFKKDADGLFNKMDPYVVLWLEPLGSRPVHKRKVKNKWRVKHPLPVPLRCTLVWSPHALAMTLAPPFAGQSTV